jgi:hypothetical protein
MKRDTPAECGIGDWVELMEFPEWTEEDGAHTWEAPNAETWHFAFAEVPTIDPEEGEVGTDFVWMRYDPAARGKSE